MSEEKKGFFSRLKEGLTKTRNNIVHGIDSVFNGFSNIDEDFYEELEEILIMGDIGVQATEAILERLREQVKENHIKEPADCKSFLIQNIKEQMQVQETAYAFEERKVSYCWRFSSSISSGRVATDSSAVFWNTSWSGCSAGNIFASHCGEVRPSKEVLLV